MCYRGLKPEERFIVNDREAFRAYLCALTEQERGGPVFQVMYWADAVRQAGYQLEIIVSHERRYYSAIDSQTGARAQVATAPGGLTDCVVAHSLALLCAG